MDSKFAEIDNLLKHFANRYCDGDEDLFNELYQQAALLYLAARRSFDESKGKTSTWLYAWLPHALVSYKKQIRRIVTVSKYKARAMSDEEQDLAKHISITHDNADTLPGKEDEGRDDQICANEMMAIAKQVLSPREYRCLVLHYLYDTPKTVIGEVENVSSERVRQIIENALKKIRKQAGV